MQNNNSTDTEALKKRILIEKIYHAANKNEAYKRHVEKRVEEFTELNNRNRERYNSALEYKEWHFGYIIFVFVVIGVFVSGLFVIPIQISKLSDPFFKQEAIEILFYAVTFWVISAFIIGVTLYATFKKSD